jgi:uncharacterized protein (TIGR02145 family)
MKNKNRICIYPLFIMCALFLTTSSCKKSSSTTPATNTITDVDGNVYHYVVIGTQTWMGENLKTTKYNDGTPIPLVTEDSAWRQLITPGYCWYNNDAATFKNIYGALYNWFTVNTGKLAPTGWHVPTDAEWTILTIYLGGDTVAGGKMKSTGTIEAGTGQWYSPNYGATNKSGFSALPAGYRHGSGAFYESGYFTSWWSSSVDGGGYAWDRRQYNTDSHVVRISDGEFIGLSVRCVRN